MVGWHHLIDGHEFEQTPGNVEEQGTLACCSPWGHKESDLATEEQQFFKYKCICIRIDVQSNKC